ncbi:hypothetical protein ACFL0Y_00080 [Patescibacteria group bacterium]
MAEADEIPLSPEGNSQSQRNTLKKLAYKPSAKVLSKTGSITAVSAGIAKGKTGSEIFSDALLLGLKGWNFKIWSEIAEGALSENYQMGNHGKITFIRHRGRRKTLDGNVRIKPGDRIGKIDLVRNLDQLDQGNIFQFSRSMLLDFLGGLIELGDDIENGDFPSDVVALTDLSHLGGMKIVQSLGFTTKNPSMHKRLYGATGGFILSKKEDKKGLKTFKNKWDKTREVWISCSQVVENQSRYRKLLEKLERAS